jgi:hypothetical protein
MTKALKQCQCCDHLTLPNRGEYDICPVCFWEDDGTDQLDVRSDTNHMTLRQGRENFSRIGAYDEAMLPHVLPKGERKRFVHVPR